VPQEIGHNGGPLCHTEAEMRLQQMANRAMDALNALRGRPPEGRVYAWNSALDSLRSTLTPRLTFAQLAGLIQSGKDGDLAGTLALYEEMEQRDLRLRSVANTRRLALTRLEYEIVSASESMQEGADKTLADDAAAYVREAFQGLDGLDTTLKHLATAIGPNLAVAEIEWENYEPIAVFPVPSDRLTMNLSQSNEVRIVTQEQRMGIPAATPKFVVHIPDSVSGSPLAKSLSEAQAWIWLMKKLALADWAIFCEIFGMPVRIGKYRPSATVEEKKTLADMLKNIGTSAWAMVSEGTAFEFAESTQRGIAPYEALLNFCNRETAVGWLGGNLTTESTGVTGGLAAAVVQDAVRDDIRDDDIKNESATVGKQLIAPVVAFKYPGRDVALPTFRRVKPEIVDRQKEALLLRAAQGAGVQVPKAWAYKRLGIPEPQEGDDVLEPTDAFIAGVTEGNPEEAAP